MEKQDLIYSDITGEIIGSAMEVHSTLGSGFLEAVYEEALAVEFKCRNLMFDRQKNLDIFYKGHKVKQYICDFLVAEKVVVEIKAIQYLTPMEDAQLLNYLKATGKKVGLLINFGSSSLKFKRFVN